jgi:hypothetical protein
MAGGTSAFDMIKRLKENANLRNKKNYFKKNHTYTETSKSPLVDNIVETKELRDQIVTMKEGERKRDIKRSIIILILSIVTLGTLVLLLLTFVKP